MSMYISSYTRRWVCSCPPIIWKVLTHTMYVQSVSTCSTTTDPSLSASPQVLPSLCHLIPQPSSQWCGKGLEVSTLQCLPHLLIVVLVKGIQVHSQRTREQNRVLGMRMRYHMCKCSLYSIVTYTVQYSMSWTFLATLSDLRYDGESGAEVGQSIGTNGDIVNLHTPSGCFDDPE